MADIPDGAAGAAVPPATEAGALPAGAAAERPHAGLGLETFAAFRSGQFRLLWISSFASTLIQGTQRFAFVWLVLSISGGSGAAGAVAFALGLPVLLFSIPIGAISDRVDRRGLLLGAQFAAMVVVAGAALLVTGGRMTTGGAFGVALLLGASTAVTQPVLRAILPTIVGRERLMNAIVLTNLASTVSQLSGAALSGAVIALWGIGAAFFMQAVIYALAGLALLPLRTPAIARADGGGGVRPLGARGLLADMREGLAFVARDRNILVLLLLLVATGILMIGPIFVLLPQIAKETMGREAFGASALFIFSGLGSIVTSLMLASMPGLRNKGGWFIGALVIGSVATAVFGLSQWYVVTAAMMVVWGMGGGLFMNLLQTLIQSNTPDEVMGRVMSLQMLGLMGFVPLGSIFAGAGAELVGAPAYMSACGALLLAIAVFTFITQPALRRLD